MHSIKTFVFTCLLLFGIAFAETLEIKIDGNYVSSQRISLSEDKNTVYNITGTIELRDSTQNVTSYALLGLVPYDADGNSLQSINDFPLPFAENQDGYIALDTLEISQNGKYPISRKIKLAGEVKSVSFVIGASLADGAKILVSDFQMEAKNSATNVETSSNLSLRDGYSKVETNQISSISKKSANTVISVKEDKQDTLTETIQNVVFDTTRIIFVNSYLGSDNLSGLKRIRGQADGPKKTIKSALYVVEDGDTIVLQESNEPYEVGSLIKTKSGKCLIIRPEGRAVIKAKH